MLRDGEPQAFAASTFAEDEGVQPHDKLVGLHKETDLALLKVEGHNFSALPCNGTGRRIRESWSWRTEVRKACTDAATLLDSMVVMPALIPTAESRTSDPPSCPLWSVPVTRGKHHIAPQRTVWSLAHPFDGSILPLDCG